MHKIMKTNSYFQAISKHLQSSVIAHRAAEVAAVDRGLQLTYYRSISCEIYTSHIRIAHQLVRALH
jgi:hypothetical protein